MALALFEASTRAIVKSPCIRKAFFGEETIGATMFRQHLQTVQAASRLQIMTY